MRVIVTGKQGQVARSLFERASAHGIEVELVGRPDLDLTDSRGIFEGLAGRDADVIVNAAAYTAVDRAESEPDRAMAINSHGAGAVAAAALLFHGSELPAYTTAVAVVSGGNVDPALLAQILTEA